MSSPMQDIMMEESPFPCTGSSTSSDSSSGGSNVSRFLAEENLIDSLFFTCDIKRSGKVPVSKILDYLKGITETADNSAENMELLAMILDPNKSDPEISITTYRHGTAAWIEQMKIKDLHDTHEMWNDSPDVFTTSLPSSPAVSRPLINKFLRLQGSMGADGLLSPLKPTKLVSPGVVSPAISSSSLEGSASVSVSDLDSSTLWGRVADLEFRNRRLCDEANSLKNQLEQSEDTCSTLSLEVDSLKLEVKSHLATIERLHEVKAENDELKALMAASEMSRIQLQHRVDRTERDNHSLEKQQLDLTYQLSDAQLELSQLQKDHDTLNNSLHDVKHVYQEMKKKADDQASQLNVKYVQLDELQSLVTDMNSINESLRKEKNDLEQHLVETVHEITASRQQSPASENASGSGSMDTVSDSESDEEIMPVRLLPTNISTPACRMSVWSELEHSLLTDEPCVPSPLCDKEMDSILLTNIKPLMLDLSMTLSPESKVSDLSDVDHIMDSVFGLEDTPGKNKIKSMASIIAEKKAYLLAQIVDSPSERSEHDMEVLSRQHKLDQIAEKMATLVSDKLMAEQKVSKYSSVLRRLHDLYRKKEKQHIDVQHALEIDCKTVTASLDDLTRVLMEDKKKQDIIKRKFEECDREMVLLREEEKCLQRELLQKTQCCNIQKFTIAQLESAKEEVETRYEKSKEDLDDIKEQLEENIAEERQRLFSLKDSLAIDQYDHQMEMKDMWRLVSRDVEADCLTDSQDTSITVSADSLRDQVAKEIESLKSQLERSQAALYALQSRALPLQSTTRDHHYDYKNNNGNSPLVEALTLGELCDKNVNVTSRLDSTSCPHLDHRHVTSSTQTDNKNVAPGRNVKRRAPHVKNSKYAVLNSSTGSSTSGVDVCSVSSRSEIHSKKSVRIVETAIDSPSSPDDPENPLFRLRTPSFKRAIERGASGDSSIISYDTIDPASTSPELSPEHGYPPPYPDYTDPYRTPTVPLSHSKHLNQPPQYHGKCESDNTHMSSVQPHVKEISEVTNEVTKSECPEVMESVNSNNQNKMELVPGSANNEGESPRSRRLSTLVEESEQEVEDPVRLPRSPRSHLPPPYPRSLPDKSKTLPLPLYKEPPAYREAIHTRSRHSSPGVISRSGFDHQRSRSLSPHAYDNPPHSPGYYDDMLQTGSSSLPASPQVQTILSPHEHRQESSSEQNKCAKNDHIESDITRTMDSKQCDNVARIESVHETKAKPVDKSAIMLKARRKSLQDMKQLSSNIVCPVNDELEDLKTVSGQSVDHIIPPVSQCQKHADHSDSLSSPLDMTKSDVRPTPALVVASPDSKKQSPRVLDTDMEHRVESQAPNNTINNSPMESPVVSPKVKKEEGTVITPKTPEFCIDSSPSLPDKPLCPDENTSPTLTSSVQNTTLREDNLVKRRNLTKQLKMPELAETASENTEFSEETISETQNDVAVDRPKAFPSISDVFLTQLKLCQGNKDKTDDPERTSEQETEDKFNRLSLAFKTDKITLDKRIELHQRARDVAEQNIDKEMVSIKEALQLLDPLCKDSKSRDVFGEIKQHVEVLDHSSTRMSSRAEILGAVKQEQRISEAIEVMIEHVENLKQTLDKEHEELEKTKKLLRENRLLGGDGDGGLPRRALSLSAKVGRRRASVAVLPRPLVLPSPIVKTINITDDLDPKVKLQNLISDSIRRASRALVNSNPVRRASIALEQLKSSSLTPKHSSSFKRTLSQNSAGNSPLAVVQENNDSAKLHDSEDGTSSDREHQQESSTECRHSDDPHSSKDVPRTSSHSSLALPDLERLQQLAQTSSSFEDEGDDDIMEADMPEYNLVEQLVELLPDWKQFMHHFRYTAAGMIFVLGVLMLMLTLIPRGSAESSQGVDGWGILEHTLWPYLEIKSTGMHPT